MGTDEPLGLPHRFKSSHPALSHLGHFMRLFCSIIGILICYMDRIGGVFKYSYPIKRGRPSAYSTYLGQSLGSTLVSIHRPISPVAAG